MAQDAPEGYSGWPSRSELWAQLGHSVTMVAKQDQVVWTIFGVFGAGHAVLLAALFANGAPVRSVGLVVSSAGVALSMAWARTQWRAIDWLEYYESILHRLEGHLGVPSSIALSAWLNVETAQQWVGRVGRGFTVRWLMRASGIVTTLFWMAALAYFVRRCW